jgi:hypothetical protein
MRKRIQETPRKICVKWDEECERTISCHWTATATQGKSDAETWRYKTRQKPLGAVCHIGMWLPRTWHIATAPSLTETDTEKL